MAIALSELLPNASIEVSYSPSNQEGETIHRHYHCVPIVFIGLANWTPRLDGNPHAVGNRSANHTLKRSASPQTWTIVRHLASGRLTYDWPAMREPTIGRHREFRHAKGGAWTATDRLCGAERFAAQSNSRRGIVQPFDYKAGRPLPTAMSMQACAAMASVRGRV